MKPLNLFIYTETSLHAGVGSTVSVIDLPIQRERATQFPLVQGSGVKGALRQELRDVGGAEAVFGIDPDAVQRNRDGQSFAGAVSVGDARIVLFPVRSLIGVFAYATCPVVLGRLSRDAVGFPGSTLKPAPDEAIVPTHNAVSASGSVVLDEFSFRARPAAELDTIASWLAQHAFPAGDEYAYWRDKVLSSLVVLPDDAFRDFVVNSTEVSTRVRLDPAAKTVQAGALWTQESMPADTVLMSTIYARRTRQPDANWSAEDVQRWLESNISGRGRIQLGGDETTGQGIVALRLHA